MSSRKKYEARCTRCLMRQELCLCAQIPQLNLATKLIIVMNKREIKVPTNTGRLAALALPHSVILSRGVEDAPYDLADHLPRDRPSILLYPADDATLLTPEWVAAEGPFHLVVPDGNWRQTSKMRRRDPVMATLPCVRLPAGAPTEYHVRKETKTEGLATIEAIARALGVLEGPAIQKALEDVFHLMVKRTLASRGVEKG
ncbi:MAG: DTW domain-containing protein [Pseudobdellovibrionaceae bacterium]|uniref:tRNA-uridine aminocarboxypropyltransferase n=1 Tax=Oligoflexus sp. TaxID=1971216 RepID=UPI0027C7E2DE|nr:tRNA-uridine aminocarboxypropyltransferase [Oligoflexus sp.]MDQ3233215.1 DTW domain-containing protein [Pseudobdellovibrionaceae bacterium]HYX37206.1 tRNA-uridine aminocarboxypropyltransferase [Oligoflexus sp.]